ncbi:hypothetical protein TYRP_016303 [Tyrophagus putrescentiae]|nr:hypothetical protein TYRP_016303 [Tyrophagus putrescentiae]
MTNSGGAVFIASATTVAAAGNCICSIVGISGSPTSVANSSSGDCSLPLLPTLLLPPSSDTVEAKEEVEAAVEADSEPGPTPRCSSASSAPSGASRSEKEAEEEEEEELELLELAW